MPNKAFEHLEDGKKKKLLKAALEEFSEYTYDQISINRIIQSIDMPRGSFYLYFNDKEDLYLYIFRKYHNILIDFYMDAIKNSSNIIDIYKQLFTKIIQYCDDGNYGNMLKMFFIGLNHNIENKLIGDITRKKIISLIKEFNDKVSIKVNDKINIEDAIDVLTIILVHSITGYYIMQLDLEMVKKRFNNQLEIIRKGIYE